MVKSFGDREDERWEVVFDDVERGDFVGKGE